MSLVKKEYLIPEKFMERLEKTFELDATDINLDHWVYNILKSHCEYVDYLRSEDKSEPTDGKRPPYDETFLKLLGTDIGKAYGIAMEKIARAKKKLETLE